MLQKLWFTMLAAQSRKEKLSANFAASAAAPRLPTVPVPAAAAELPDVSKMDIRVGRIISCEKHPEADRQGRGNTQVPKGGAAAAAPPPPHPPHPHLTPPRRHHQHRLDSCYRCCATC